MTATHNTNGTDKFPLNKQHKANVSQLFREAVEQEMRTKGTTDQKTVAEIVQKRLDAYPPHQKSRINTAAYSIALNEYKKKQGRQQTNGVVTPPVTQPVPENTQGKMFLIAKVAKHLLLLCEGDSTKAKNYVDVVHMILY